MNLIAKSVGMGCCVQQPSCFSNAAPLHFFLDKCMPPAPPYQPQIVVVSDSEVALSWKPGVSEGSSPIRYYTVEFIRQVC